jgi:hypothetical protein
MKSIFFTLAISPSVLLHRLFLCLLVSIPSIAVGRSTNPRITTIDTAISDLWVYNKGVNAGSNPTFDANASSTYRNDTAVWTLVYEGGETLNGFSGRGEDIKNAIE